MTTYYTEIVEKGCTLQEFIERCAEDFYRYNEADETIEYYKNKIQEKVKELIDFLQQKYGGKALFRQSRVFLQGSKEFNDKNEIANLANEISSKFNGPIEITLEFEKITSEEQEQNTFNFPAGKALPIAGSD